MKLLKRTAQPAAVTKYYPAVDGKKSFIMLPASMVEPTKDINGYNRVVAFGTVADAINKAVDKGLSKLDVVWASLRDNSFDGIVGTIKQTDLVCHEVKIGKKSYKDEFATEAAGADDGVPF